MKTFQEFTTEAYGRGPRPVRGRDYDDYKDWKPSLYKSGSHRTQDKTPPTHPAAHLKPKKKSAAERMDAAGKRLGLPEEVEIEEGMSMKDFKANRRKLKRREASADAKKRGHVGKEWYNSGRTYSPDEAKRMRSNLDDEERSTRHRSSIDPEGDDSNYSADKTKNPKKLRKQKAMGEEVIDEILMVTPTTKKTATKSQSKPKRDPYGEDPAVTRKRLVAKIKKLKEEDEIEEGIGMTMANALGNPPALSKRMKLKQALIINKIKSDAEKNKKKRYSGKAATTNEEYVEELFVTRKSPEQRADEKRKKKVAELIRLMKYAKDPSSDVARKPVAKEEYIDETSLNRVRSKSEKGGMAIMSAQRGDKSKSENKARSKQLEKDIRGAGLPGPTKVSGRYTENPGTSQEKKVGEKSHVVSSGKMGKRKFKKAITKLGKKYNQDSVLIQKKPKGSAQLVGTNKSWPGEGKRVKVGKMNPGKTGEFDTKVKNKTFTYEEYEN